MPIPPADYVNERHALEALFEPDCPRPIILIKGRGGSGKTMLVEHCLRAHTRRTGATVVPIQLRGSAVTIAEIFYRLGRQIGWTRLRGFTRQVAELAAEPQVRINNNWLAGINNKIIVSLRADSLGDQEQRRAALTEALFVDLEQLRDPVLVAFDTYDQATSDVGTWIAGPLLARVTGAPAVRVLIAGQEVPDAHNIEWGENCASFELRGVPEASHWLPVVRALGCLIPAENELDWLGAVCYIYKGWPLDIMNVLTGLPVAEPQP
jgi:hypothetical protein